jgi:C-terminal processing protease CtpA/Prc
MIHRAVTFGVFALLTFNFNALARKSDTKSQCEMPEYFGICDPYVPGTIISLHDKQPIPVKRTWHDGPAERAGVCPGDKILAVNGVLASQSTSNRMLREIVSDTPQPILLTILRGDKQMEFRMRRVRESTLARLSHQKFMQDPQFSGVEAMVPLNESRKEFSQYIAFMKRLEEVNGYTRIEGLQVPEGTPPAQVEELQKFLSFAPLPERVVGFVPVSDGKYSLGVSFVVVQDPPEVLVEAVIPHSPANRAGLFPGDILLKVDDSDASAMSLENLQSALLKPDQVREVNLEVNQNGEDRSFRMRTEEFSQIMKDDFAVPVGGDFPSETPDYYFLGFEVLYTGNLREAVISEVDWPSPAFDAGLRVGDSILAFGGKPIAVISRDKMEELLTPHNATSITLELSRLGKTKSLRVTPTTYRMALGSIGRKWTPAGPAPDSCVNN